MPGEARKTTEPVTRPNQDKDRKAADRRGPKRGPGRVRGHRGRWRKPCSRSGVEQVRATAPLKPQRTSLQ